MDLSQVRALTDALHTPGTCPIIHGDRGLGKSSLALQMVRIAMGDTELLEHLGMGDDAFQLGEVYTPFYFPCSDDIGSSQSLLNRLVVELEAGNAGLPDAGLKLSEETSRFRVSLKLVEAETVKKYSMKAKSTGRFEQLAPQDQVLRLCGSISDATGRPVLVVIDELDLVEDTGGLASFIKSSSSENLKFMLVGIAQDVSNLVDGHASISRLALPVEVPRMNPVEEEEIITTACTALQLEGIDIDFSSSARLRMIELANGFPWFIHVLGQEALIRALDAGDGSALPRMIEDGDVDEAVNGLVLNRYLQEFRDLYQAAVRDSRPREILLRALAGWNDRDIPTADVYRVVRTLGVANPSTYLGHLGQAKYGAPIERPPYQKRGLVRFKNAMFKTYVRMRPSIYRNVDTRVAGAWANH